ncbi:MAG: pentapeptide repeat-containing protein [Allosphingosinicella sp.]
MRGAQLESAHLEGAALARANLEGAYLEGAHLKDAVIWEAHLEGAVLIGAHLEGAGLGGAHLQRATLLGAKGVTQEELNSALGDEKTTLPSDLTRPGHWSKPQTNSRTRRTTPSSSHNS